MGQSKAAKCVGVAGLLLCAVASGGEPTPTPTPKPTASATASPRPTATSARRARSLSDIAGSIKLKNKDDVMQELQRRSAEAAVAKPTPATGKAPSTVTSAPGATQAEESVLKIYCHKEWPDNYEMESYCVDQQRKAVRALNDRTAATASVPQEVFGRVRGFCSGEWPGNYEMRDYCEKQQIEAYHKLQGDGR